MIEIIFFLFAYFIGNLLTGQLLAKGFYHKDLYLEGSGNVGARNAGRIFGKTAFLLTFFGDAGKGAIVMICSQYMGLPPSKQLLALFLAILGHIFPVLFRFKGGKGMATFIGGVLAFHPLLFALFVGVFLCLYVLMRSLTMAGMIAVVSLPMIMVFYSYSTIEIILSFCISGLVLFAHRQNMKLRVQKGG
ncbi:glycerol-3-phosphate acyltransferase [Lederbergia sp. NSJ-179]|uniref:glycerol-3-phosphate acyltransferase n=1 Tax=Lederbergia sp. NSJ-179 TaxID=2931402 RepID=UPI001FD021C6|nr:glycerol-3-phosphate acyltransferase [Lederbergia sp. NSJ-179]MCJ7840826.1 glycerol-3-phosphate acyltransferase [Lederbergia sp. NSJ-179]